MSPRPPPGSYGRHAGLTSSPTSVPPTAKPPASGERSDDPPSKDWRVGVGAARSAVYRAHNSERGSSTDSNGATRHTVEARAPRAESHPGAIHRRLAGRSAHETSTRAAMTSGTATITAPSPELARAKAAPVRSKIIPALAHSLSLG